MSKKGMEYDYKKAYDKNLKPSARLHYLENARHDQDSGSPNKFMGGIAAGMAGLGGSQSLMNKFLESSLGRAAQQVAGPTQAQQAAAATVPEATINDGVDPILAGAGVVPPGTMDQVNPFEGKTFQITPANMMGNAKPTFSAPVQASAEAIYGSSMQRQMSMPNSGSVTQMKSPLEGNAFIGAKMAAEKAGESTFEVDGKTFNVK